MLRGKKFRRSLISQIGSRLYVQVNTLMLFSRLLHETVLVSRMIQLYFYFYRLLGIPKEEDIC